MNSELKVVLLSALIFSNIANAGGAPAIRIVKMEPIAASGECTPQANADQVQEVMKRFDLDIINGKATNDVALSRGLLEIEKLAGGRFRPAEGATFKILPQRGCAQQMGQTIVLRQGCGSLNSVAYYVHELGHYIGNNDKAKLYSEYKASVTSRCAVSKYAMKDWTRARARNEEFAEVLAAFVTNPKLLQNAGPNCIKAFSFFRDKVFDRGQLVGCRPSEEKMIVVAENKFTTKLKIDFTKKPDSAALKTLDGNKSAIRSETSSKSLIAAESGDVGQLRAKKTDLERQEVGSNRKSKALQTGQENLKKISYQSDDIDPELENCSESALVDDDGIDI